MQPTHTTVSALNLRVWKYKMKLITDHMHFIVIVFIYSVWKFSDMYLKYMTNFTIELSKNFTDIKKCTWLVWLTLFFPTVVVLVLHGCLEVMVLLLLLMPMGTCMCMKRQALSSYISPCCKFWFEHVFTLFFFLFSFFLGQRWCKWFFISFCQGSNAVFYCACTLQ